ncbi:succinyldiaminopimelate transaminase [Sulfurimonas sp. MAG313]|nr:succinyldiaminopimelate transaminase [Sulfurimonas sp. MAG313]MDF1880348.1 succinyldiaminopimelate transaminase [Sulfurimonas sp. MAG313]
MKFESYPFEKLNTLLADISPNQDKKLIALTIGEPQFETPSFIQDALKNSSSLLKKYPKTAGEKETQAAMINFNKKRFNVNLKEDELIPCFGTREVLFNFPQFLLFDVKNPVMAFTNPFYQIYEGSAIASRAKMVLLNLTKGNEFKPSMSEEQMQEADFVILNFPNNPTASVLSLEELGEWVLLALKYDFVLMNDECYSEIYIDTPPPSLLEAAKHVGNESLQNTLVINSISKRSSAPGLRSGFIAGDAQILKSYMQYRTYVGCASPLPLQAAAAVAWEDEKHVRASRIIYKKNFEIAHEILGTPIPQASFYIWFSVDDEIAFTKKLFKEHHVKVLPGSFLARDDEKGENPGKGYIRIALVHDAVTTRQAMEAIHTCLNS